MQRGQEEAEAWGRADGEWWVRFLRLENHSLAEAPGIHQGVSV